MLATESQAKAPTGPGLVKARPDPAALARGILNALEAFPHDGLEAWQSEELSHLELQAAKLLDALKK